MVERVEAMLNGIRTNVERAQTPFANEIQDDVLFGGDGGNAVADPYVDRGEAHQNKN